MKKLLFLLPMAMLAFCLSACSDDEDDIAPDTPVNPDTPTSLGFSVTASMIEVGGLTEDCTVSVNNTACTVEIALALVDAEQISALAVSIVNLPDGATATPSSFTGDFSGGQTTSVTFSNDGYDVDFVFSASVTGTPSFTGLTLDGVDALSGEVTLPETSDVTAVKVEFTTDPAGTTVTVGSTAVTSGDTVDFTEAVTFTLDFAGYTSEFTVTATVESGEEPEPKTGISSVTRVWGAYYGETPFTGYDITNWRSVAMDDSYFYTATTSAAGGVYAISISNPEAGLTTMSMDGVSGGAHATSHLKTIQNGTSTKILVCNLLTAEGTLKVYAYDSPGSTPTTLLEASTAGYGDRYGDKFSVYGDWSDGGLLFWCANGTQALEFIISNGTVTNASSPNVVSFASTPESDYKGSYGNIYRYNDTDEYLYASANAYMSVWKRSENSLTNECYADSARYHSKHQQSPKFFTFNGAEYMAYIDIETNNDVVLCIEDFEHEEGFVYNIQHSRYQDNLLNGEALGFNAEISLGVESNMENGKVGLATSVSTNSLGDLDVREINGETYIVAIGQYIGISLFKLNAAD